ncbi:hypothetical protein SESBI_41076 [Sesbania bispinosa]|nr:hypothetical protein SESBI_41076 [Sesbania bispinosa]
MFAIIGLASAASAPTTSPTDEDYLEDDNEFLIGTRNGDAHSPSSVVAAPIGGPVPPGAFDNAQAAAPSAAFSSLHHLSAFAGAATVALAGFFYF